MHLALDIFQGMGIAAAVGIRPFLPALAVGALAAGDVQIDFKHTDFSFVASWPFLLALLGVTVLIALLERRVPEATAGSGPAVAILMLAALALGALLFAGALAQDRYASWPGLLGGVACAAAGLLAARPMLARVRARLSGDDAALLGALAEGIALAAAVLTVLLPPAGLLVVALLVWLALAARRREGEKYAGLRILR